MFQSFTENSFSCDAKHRLALLRQEMAGEAIDWYLVPHGDEHQNEYLPARAERLAWLTGFTGSAGFALVGKEKAFVFADGRYTAQLRQQIDIKSFQPEDLVNTRPSKFIQSVAVKDEIIGFDPWLVTMAELNNWQKSANQIGAAVKPVDNLIDRIWSDQPEAPLGKVRLYPETVAGETPPAKLAKIRQTLKQDGADFLLMNNPASLAWTFNIRGSDVPHNPLVLGYAIVPANTEHNGKPLLFIDKQKLDTKSRKSLRQIANIFEPRRLEQKLRTLSKRHAVHCDPRLVPAALAEIITRAKGSLIKKRDPVVILRALKNNIELNGCRAAHLRDGVACVKFLHWLDRQLPATIDEITAAKKLEEFRKNTARAFGSELKEIAFDTISGAGANGAIVHYRVSEKTNAMLQNNSIYLVDSGGQYEDGTTDITRTVAIGTPPAGAITDFTLVLKGHIAIARARFPQGTRGIDLDVLARNSLWQHGKDYAHGTGHGVGVYLNVHEGPQSISKRGMEPLQASMIISNEPGFYREGHYGIRIENLLIVKGPEAIDGGQPMLGFETVTCCPIDLRLVDPLMMNDDELQWLNAYHGWVRQALVGHLTQAEQEWLAAATQPIFRQPPVAPA